jgi:hypothetical protein
MAQGASLADAAYVGGFADQAHLTRTMLKILGVTPPSGIERGSVKAGQKRAFRSIHAIEVLTIFLLDAQRRLASGDGVFAPIDQGVVGNEIDLLSQEPNAQARSNKCDP